MYYGHGLIAGGWALLYFTTYAIFNIKAIQIFHNPVLCTVLLAIIAAGMIGHSITYNNEWFTLICYFLGFVSMILIMVNTLSLIGTAILAISLIVVSYKSKWDYLNLLGIITCYLIWGYWFSKTGHFDNRTFFLGASILSRSVVAAIVQTVVLVGTMLVACLPRAGGSASNVRWDSLSLISVGYATVALLGVLVPRWLRARRTAAEPTA